MRLFLSSYRADNHEAELIELFGKGSKVAVITNAKDDKPETERKESVNEGLEYFSKLGFKPIEIDLRKYFGDMKKLDEELRQYPAVWGAGGNTFLLRRALSYSGTDRLLYDLVRKNEISYGGESAGAILATPSLQGTQHGDDPHFIPKGYQKEIIWDGLDFVAYHIVPHYKSNWFGIEAEAMLDYMKQNQLDYRTLMDGQAIMINGDKEEFLA
jgi:dipeptidase E